MAGRIRDAVWEQVRSALQGEYDPYAESTSLIAGEGYEFWVDYHLLLLEERPGGLRSLFSPDQRLVHELGGGPYLPPIPDLEGQGWQTVHLPNPRTPSPAVRLACRRYAFVPRIQDRAWVLREQLLPAVHDHYRQIARPGIFVEALRELIAATFEAHPGLRQEEGERADAYREVTRGLDALASVHRERVLTAFSWDGRGSEPPLAGTERKAWSLYRTLRDAAFLADMETRDPTMSDAIRGVLAEALRSVVETPARFVRLELDEDPPRSLERVEEGRTVRYRRPQGPARFLRHYLHTEDGVERSGDRVAFYQPACEQWPELVEANLLQTWQDLLPDAEVAALRRRLGAGQLPRREPDPTREQTEAQDAGEGEAEFFERAWRGLEAQGAALRAFYQEVAARSDLPPWSHARDHAARLGTGWLPIPAGAWPTLRRLYQGGSHDPYPVLVPDGRRRSAGGEAWFELEYKDNEGRSVGGVEVVLTLPDGSTRVATTDASGVARWEGIPEGEVTWEVADSLEECTTDDDDRDDDPIGPARRGGS